jgi:hypothetical protein
MINHLNDMHLRERQLFHAITGKPDDATLAKHELKQRATSISRL